MPITSIDIRENPISNAGDYQKDFIEGTDSAWISGSYRHEIRTMGGFWSSRFNLQPEKIGLATLEELLLNGLTREVTSHDSRGGVAWNGFISRMVLRYPGGRAEVGIKNMTNKLYVNYMSTPDGVIDQTSVVEDTVSQGKYGIKEKYLQGGVISVGAVATQGGEIYLDKWSDPRNPSMSIRQQGSGRGGAMLEVHCSGYFSTLNWIAYNEIVNQDDQDLSLQIKDILTDCGQFVNLQTVTDNTSQVNQFYDADEPGGNAILDLARGGDSSNNRYYAGMYENRLFVYDQVRDDGASNVKYKIRTFNNIQIVTEPGSGILVDPAAVRPNNWIRVSDLFSGFQVDQSGSQKDPRVSFVENVIYTEPWGLQISSNRADQNDNLFATAGFNGASFV